ncbi:MAG: glutamate 5-kinase [Anaerolineaceae bacterium]|nr:glutamate 5-kinase [Anaerolineaceae bacterium]MDE0329112.1 glutamate 5-kinase [Anaerolineaceae bacterium]
MQAEGVTPAGHGASTPLRLVIKLGSSVLTSGTRRLDRACMLNLVQQIAQLQRQGHETVVVTSGAQAAGREILGFPELERSLPSRQMLAAVGQGRLMQIYSELFADHDIIVGQVLLTRSDLNHRTRYLNARDTLLTMIDQGIVPVVNENDTTAVEEIRVGDNDNISALVANLLEADLLILLTDQAGMFTADPRRDQDASLIQQLERVDDSALAMAGGAGSSEGTGGMATKLQAARLASNSGVSTVIARGLETDVMQRILQGGNVGTRIPASVDSLQSRKRWLLAEVPRGILHVDAGAVHVLRNGGASLLPVGVTRVEREFRRGEVVQVQGPDGSDIARGLSSYDSAELRSLCGQRSSRIGAILGYSYGDAAIHRNNLVLST